MSSREQAIRHLLSTLVIGKARAITAASEIDVVGHRVVLGGPHFEDPVIITPEVYSVIASVSAFAPRHIRAELEGVKIIENIRSDLPQMAVFDTGFYRQMPLSAPVYPGPYEWFENSNQGKLNGQEIDNVPSTLEFLGLQLDSQANVRPSFDQDVSTADSRVRVLVIRAEEDSAIARECWKLAHVATHLGETEALRRENLYERKTSSGISSSAR